MSTRKQQGQQGEELVIKELGRQGFLLLAQNFHSRFGEIDIIARKKDLIIFVEVKLRSSRYFDLSTVITPLKQHKIIMTAKYFIALHDHNEMSYRFDVALLEPDAHNNITLNYISDAFREDE